MTAKIFLFFEQNSFSEFVQKWCEGNGIEVEIIDTKSDYLEVCDGMVMFHENHNFSRPVEDQRDIFDRNSLPIHKVDINGTVVATTSNFIHWLERNNIKKLAITGDSSLSSNENLTRFFDKIALK